MSRVIDLTGQVFGKLTVISQAPSVNGRAMWNCQCECGNQVICPGRGLRDGSSRSCGCLKKQDLVGKVFGRLTVLDYAYSKNGSRYWKCQCECGNITYVTTKSLNNGNTQSCGCLHHDTIRKINIETKSKINQASIIGKTFDFLTVLEQVPSEQGKTYYLCKCNNCGNVKKIAYSDLASDRVHACGCLNSWGEAQLRSILDKYNIKYISQFSFEDLYSNKHYPLRFDFAILNNDNKVTGLIEFQGEQHTRISSNWHTEQLVQHDKMKKEYCETHHFPLMYCDKQTNLEDFVKGVVLPMATIGI